MVKQLIVDYTANKLPNSLGKKEILAISRMSYAKVNIITLEKLKEWFGKDRSITQLVFQLRKKGILRPITKGVYFFSSLEAGPGGGGVESFKIAQILFPKNNYYIGYSTMYNIYGYSEQIVQTTFILNTSIQREKIIQSRRFQLLKIPENRMYGIIKSNLSDGSEVYISDRERTLVDVFYYPGVVEFERIVDILKNEIKYRKEFNLDKFIKYAIRFPIKSTRKRIGYYLEQVGVPILKLLPLANTVKGNTKDLLNNSKPRKGILNEQWRLIING